MELSKTDFDIDLDQCDTDIPWLKSVPSKTVVSQGTFFPKNEIVPLPTDTERAPRKHGCSRQVHHVHADGPSGHQDKRMNKMNLHY